MHSMTNSMVEFSDDDMFQGLGAKVTLSAREDFLKVKETLTRIGVVKGNVLEQTCFILHKRGEYAIMHYLEMQMLDGDPVHLSEEDEAHRDTVAHLLDQWNLVELQEHIDSKFSPVTVVPFRSKKEYVLRPMYEIGKTR